MLTFGILFHLDYGMLTFLLTDDVPGLEILQKANGSEEGKWLAIEPRPGAFIVNLGDMLARWTNDLYASTVHRVVNRTGQQRFSIPFFFEPNFDTVVECLPQCVSEERPSRYPEPTTSGEFLLAKYAITHTFFEAEN